MSSRNVSKSDCQLLRIWFKWVHMPLMDGLEATQAIRADSPNRATPIIALTASAFDDDRTACLAAGMNGHIAKPVHPEMLYETVWQFLKRGTSH